MILASHVIISAYGFWLPNDPRGSWSDFVASWELFRFGPATKVETRDSVARRPHDVSRRFAAKRALTYAPVRFAGVQAQAIGAGFADAARRANIALLACAIVPDHSHLVVERHRHPVEQLVNFLKGNAKRTLLARGLHPFGKIPARRGSAPSMWAGRMWKVFLDSEDDVQRAIAYVERNPVKEGKPLQRWSFVRERTRVPEGRG